MMKSTTASIAFGLLLMVASTTVVEAAIRVHSRHRSLRMMNGGKNGKSSSDPCECDGSKEYRVDITPDTYVFHEANARAEGCTLATMEDAEENALVLNALQTANAQGLIAPGGIYSTNIPIAWVGLYRPINPIDATSGGPQGGWIWADGGCTDYTAATNFFRTDEPLTGMEEIVAVMYYQQTPGNGAPILAGQFGDISVPRRLPAVYECCDDDSSSSGKSKSSKSKSTTSSGTSTTSSSKSKSGMGRGMSKSRR